MDKISIIISYSSIEKIFLRPLLQQCSLFSDDIVVSYGSNLYNGKVEKTDFLEEIYDEFPYVQFVQYEVDLTIPENKRNGVINRPTSYFHNLSRKVAVERLRHKDWVFVIDADEIPDGEILLKWLDENKYMLNKNNCYKFACYWYFKKPTFRAKAIEDSILLIHYDYLTDDNLFGDNERDHLIACSETGLIRQVRNDANLPMWHHFSFVRSREQLFNKLTSWAHKDDVFKNANIHSIIDFIYHNDEVNDVIHNYSYDVVPNKFNIDMEEFDTSYSFYT